MRRTKLVRLAGLLVVPLALAAAVPAVSSQDPSASTRKVVVMADSPGEAAAAVRAAGGTVLDQLPLVDGVVAQLPAGRTLGPGVVVTEDRALSFTATEADDSGAANTVRQTLGLPATGTEGQGVTVAVVDTGVATLPALEPRVTAHVDVTGTGGGDGYGHGTFMAGLIVGTSSRPGVAPGARLLDVKVAGPDGSTSLTAVMRGLQVVANRARTYGVRVLNLSLSSGSPVPYQVDPLVQALEGLWSRGIVVVTPAGNDGPTAGTIASPGISPVVLTAGGLDESATAARDDDVVASWSSRSAPGGIKPDLVAPAAHLVSLRAPGSVIDTDNPLARIGDDQFRGSGSSMAAAVTSGAAAAVLAAHPGLTPDAVKASLVGTAYRAAGLKNRRAAGAGGLDVAAAIAGASSSTGGSGRVVQSPPQRDLLTWLTLSLAFDSGDGAAAERAWNQLSQESKTWATRQWADLSSDQRAQASQAWESLSWKSLSWKSLSWKGDVWVARYWASLSWKSLSWKSLSWKGDDWASLSWKSLSWKAEDWASLSWKAQTWAGQWR